MSPVADDEVPLTLEESARLVGGCRWLELEVFRVCGGAVRGSRDAPVVVALSELATHAGWRAAQLGERLPQSGSFSVDDVSVPPDGHVGATADPAAIRVALEGLAERYSRLAGRLVGPADRAIARTVGQCLVDVRADLAVLDGCGEAA